MLCSVPRQPIQHDSSAGPECAPPVRWGTAFPQAVTLGATKLIMRSIYIDESAGTVLGGDMLAVAGYIATDEAWARFAADWQAKVLDKYSLPYFHATDLRNADKRLYRHLSLAERHLLISTVSDVIATHIEAGFGVCLRPSDWEKLTNKAERTRWGGAYEFCVHFLMPVFSEHLASTERVNVFLEDGHKNTKAALSAIADYKQATEPIQWPPMVGEGEVFAPDDVQINMRISNMRMEVLAR